MKKISYYLSFLLLCTATTFISCDDEQLEGEFFSTPDGSDPAVFCAETGPLAIAEAQFALIGLDPSEAQAGCDALKGTINSFIATCGDEGGGLQLLLDELGDDCNLMIADNNCESATTAAELLEDQFNNATTQEDIDSFCALYEQALINQIQECGDADGSIQAAIDALPCT